MKLNTLLKKDISAELMRTRYQKSLAARTVAKKCNMQISQLDKIELGQETICYSSYNKLLNFYNKDIEVFLVEKNHE